MMEMITLMDHRHHGVDINQFSSRSDIRNPIKNDPVLHPGVGSWVVEDENGRWVGGPDDIWDCPRSIKQ